MILNHFHPNITFSYEIEQSIKLSLLEAFLIKEGSNIVTTVANEYTSLFRLKIQEFDVIKVLFKPSSIFQRFD